MVYEIMGDRIAAKNVLSFMYKEYFPMLKLVVVVVVFI